MPLFTKPAKLENIWAATGDKSPPPDDGKISQGFVVEIPLLEQFNFIDGKQDSMLAHLNQRGIAEWDSVSSYYANISYVQGSNGVIYRAKLDSGGSLPSVNPVTEVGAVTWGVAFYFITDVYTKTESNNLYLSKSSNLSDLTNTTTARSNLSVYSISQSDNLFTKKSNNLSDVSNALISFDNLKQQATENYVGVAKISTDSQVSTGTDDTSIITPKKLRLGFSVNLASSGHIAFPSWLGGLIINWGRSYVGDASQVNVAFSKPFPTTMLQAVVGPYNLGTSTSSYIQRSTCSWTYVNNYYIGLCSNRDGGAGFEISYFAIGY